MEKESGFEVEKEELPPSNINKELFDIAETVTHALVVVVLVFTFFFRIVGVSGESMRPTLENKDYILITDFFYSPKRGDIVVVTVPGEENPLVKRIIAVGGDSVDIYNDQGAIYVNDERVSEKYIPQSVRTEVRTDDFSIQVKPGEVFLLGDNRPESKDSREFGCVNEKLIQGMAFFRLVPFGSFGQIGNDL
ncbi:MAG: signal peptidase I [Oscillospiraceae bacterium]|nr:signal peptidase I [Oscillospiraceae bacterium]